MSGLAAVKLTATLKSPIQGLTIARLRAALDELEAVANVPATAELHLVHYREGGWELTAKWLPESIATPPGGPGPVINIHSSLAEPAEVIAERIRKDHGHNQVQL